MAIAVATLGGTTGSSGTSIASWTITQPTGLMDGLVLYLVVGTNNSTSTQGNQAKNTDSTWTRLVAAQDNPASPQIGISLFRRIVATAASEPASYAFSNVDPADDTTTHPTVYGWSLIGLTGVDQTTPEDVTAPAPTGTSTAGTTIAIPATSSTTDNAWAIGGVVNDTTGGTWTAPSGYANLNTVNTGRMAALATLGPITPAGSIASTSFTSSASSRGVGAQVAVRPASGGATTLVSPASDVAAGGWTTNSGSTTNLYATIDESVASDTDYVQSSLSPASDAMTVALASASTPPAGTQILHYRYGKDMLGGNPMTLTVDLMQGATVVQTWTHTDLPDGWTQADQTVTGTITDYTTLRLRFTAS